MRSVVRVLTAGFAVTLAAMPLIYVGGEQVGADRSHALSAPAQVAASNWSTMPTSVTPNATSVDQGVSCVQSTFCMAVGNGYDVATPATNAELWEGTTWVSQPMPTVPNSAGGAVLASVSCVTAYYCFAAGYAYPPADRSTYTSLIEVWNDGRWSVVPNPGAPPTDNYLFDISCLSWNFCFAVGGTATAPYAELWNGSTWTPSTLSAPAGSADTYFNGVSCVTVSSCMAVGGMFNGTNTVPVAESWNGATWTMTPVPAVSQSPDYGLDSVSCAGTGFCAAVGGNHNTNVVNTWNGSFWTLESSVPTPSAGGNLYAISCFSATSCTAVGAVTSTTTTPQALTWDGQNWSAANTPPAPPSSTGGAYNAVDCLTNWACVAAGDTQSGAGPSTTYLPLQANAPIARSGYRFVASDGGLFNFGPTTGGGAPFLGSMGGQPLNAPIAGMATMPAGDGYFEVASDGGVFNFGSAKFYGSTGSIHLNKPVVGMAVTSDGGGYWLVASDGGVFAFGDAAFYGSMGGQALNKPMVGIAPTANGYGYYEVASDGGIFAFPTGVGWALGPNFLGSTGGMTLNKPVVGMAVNPAGQYYLVASDGGVFAYPQEPPLCPFYGSTGSIKLNQPIVGMAVTAGGSGYYLGAADGGIFTFPPGAAGPPFYGSRGGQPLNNPIVGIAG